MVKKGKNGKFEKMEKKDLDKELRWLKEKKIEENKPKTDKRRREDEQNQQQLQSKRRPGAKSPSIHWRNKEQGHAAGKRRQINSKIKKKSTRFLN